MLVCDTDPELRSLLTACQVADDPSGPMSALASWLDNRQDPRGAPVRLGARYWHACHREPEIQDRPEFDDLERRMDDEGDEVLVRWLGFRGDGDTVGVSWHRPLVYLSVNEFAKLPVQACEIVRAGWVWQLDIVGPRVDEALDTLLAEPGPIREVAFFGNQSLRDADLEALTSVPHLREVDLSRTRITDRGLRHLHRIRTLRHVHLEYTPRVTTAGVAALQEALPACAVRGL
jgi:Leucine Rich repeat